MDRDTASGAGCLQYHAGNVVLRKTARPQPTPGHLSLTSGVHIFVSPAVSVSFLLP